MITATGLQIDVEQFRLENVRAWDIGWSLHHVNLFGGHAPLPWDALSHIGLSYLLYINDVRGKTEVPFSLALLLAGSAKAYMGDTMNGNDILQIIYERFNVPQGPGSLDWDTLKKYDRQAAAIEFHALFPQLKDSQYAPKLQYDISKYPLLVKAKVADYITLLRHLAINNDVTDIDTLFAVTDSLKPYLAAEIVEKNAVEQQGHIDTEFRETKSIEEMRI